MSKPPVNPWRSAEADQPNSDTGLIGPLDPGDTRSEITAFEQHFVARIEQWAASEAFERFDSFVVAPHEPKRPGTLAIGWWQATNGRIRFPAVWDEPEAVALMEDYCWGSTNRLISGLAERLNLIHGVSYPLVYWKALLGPWALLFTSTVADHRLACLGASSLDPTAPFLTSDESLPPPSADAWLADLDSAAGKQNLLSEMIRAMDLPARELQCDGPCCAAPNDTMRVPGHRVRAAVDRFVNQSPERTIRLAEERVAGFCFGGNAGRGVEILDCRLSLAQALALYLGVRRCRIGSRAEVKHGRTPPRGSAIDVAARYRLLDIPTASHAEAVMVKTLPRLLPTSLLEDYDHTVWESRRLYGNASHLVHGNYRWDEVQNEFLGRCLVAGRRVAFMQHGGSYGQLRVHGWSRLEQLAETQFLSWGWTGRRVVPLPSGSLSRIRDRHNGGDSVPVIEGPPAERCVMFHFSSVDPVRRGEGGSAFIDSITNPQIRAKVIRKGFPTRSAAPRRSPSALRLMLTARVVVITYPDTPLLEALAANVPVIAFWDPAAVGFRPEATALFEQLAAVGILYGDPHLAANALEEVYWDAHQWWSRTDIQSARQQFLAAYGRNRDWTRQWIGFLRTFASDGRAPMARTAQPE